MRNLLTIAIVGMVLVGLMIGLSGCLTPEYKEYYYTINGDGTGEGRMKFINIVSEEEDEENMSAKDFGELITNYYEGEQFSEDNPYLTVTDKKLYEENEQLMGEVWFTFDSVDSVGFYRHEDCECCPWMFYFGSLSETYVESNGTYLGTDRDFPMIIWDEGQTEFYFKTLLKEDMSNGHSLLPFYRTWLETQ